MKRTGGGLFDPTDRGIYFVAGDNAKYPRYVLQAVNEILTPGEEKTFAALLDAGHTVFLDSGIFWLTNIHKRTHGITMDEALSLAPHEIDGFEELHTRYVDLCGRYGDRLWGYIELDQGGAVNKRQTRSELESLGLAPIPVYHPINDGWDYFDELAQSYDRICFGNIVQASPPARLRLLHTAWERHRQYPDLWIHILGLTANEWCLPFPPDSCDSSSWLNPLRFPAVNTETALMRKLGDLGNGWSYDLTDPGHPERGRFASAEMCKDAAAGLNTVWRHAVGRSTELLGQPAYPARLDEEGQLCPTV